MADYEINVDRDMLPGLPNGPEGLAKLVETVLNQVLEAQMTEHLGAEPHERTTERQGYRNGVRPRTLTQGGSCDPTGAPDPGRQLLAGDV